MKIHPFQHGFRRLPGRLGWMVVVLVCLGLRLLAADPGAAGKLESAYRAARSAYETNRESVVPAWQYARAAYDWAEVQERDSDRARIAEAGIAACRHALNLDPASAQTHYYLALCLGQLARTRKLGALGLVSQMEGALLTAKTLDDRFDFAGPDRSLAMLYLDAPGWPTSIGSRGKSRRHFERTIVLEPSFPENRLSFAEALIRWHDMAAAHDQLRALEASWDESKKKWTGPNWEISWADWEKRRRTLKDKLNADGAEGPKNQHRGKGP